jgi:hypothetical protein
MWRQILAYLVLVAGAFVLCILVELSADAMGISDLILYIPVGVVVFTLLGRHYYRQVMSTSLQTREERGIDSKRRVERGTNHIDLHGSDGESGRTAHRIPKDG